MEDLKKKLLGCDRKLKLTASRMGFKLRKCPCCVECDRKLTASGRGNMSLYW